LTLDLSPLSTRQYLSLFTTGHRLTSAASPPRLARLFWLKDVGARYARDWQAYAAQQWIVLALGASVISIVAVRTRREAVPAALIAAAETVAVVTPAALLAFLQALNGLGIEGEGIALLRPVLTARALFTAKAVANGAYVLTHAGLHALLLLTAARLMHVDALPIFVALALAVATGAAFSLFASALGFLLPDFHARAALAPGASLLAKTLYLAGVLCTVATLAGALATAANGPVTPLGVPAFAIALLVGVSLVAIAWGTQRFDRLEV
jgi:hypothetical protein